MGVNIQQDFGGLFEAGQVAEYRPDLAHVCKAWPKLNLYSSQDKAW